MIRATIEKLDRMLGDKPAVWGWTRGEIAVFVGYHLFALGVALVWVWWLT